MQFDHFDIDAFLRDSWQKKAVLIRNPWRAWRNPLEPDELAGLACEEDIESRLLVQAGGAWQLEHGPFAEERFATLTQQHWTLLVQAVDHYVPDVAALIEPFRFLPNWRIDDVMVSYAADGSGVGPHFDQYDVFLIQGLGRRRWQVGAVCDASSALMPHDDLRLLAGFEATEEWILEPGDILYVPPGVAHNGVALGDDCMTYSIGFRAPARSELIEQWSEHLLERLPDDDRYADPGLPRQSNSGEITPAALAGLHAMIAEAMLDRDAFARWFGQYGTTRKYPEIDWQPEQPVTVESLRAALADDAPLRRNAASRFAFIRQPEGAVLLFVDGHSFACSAETAALAERLCAEDCLEIGPDLPGGDAALALLVSLCNQGSIGFDDED